VLADGLDAGFVRLARQARMEAVRSVGLGRGRRRSARGWCRRCRHRQPGVDIVEPPGQPSCIAIEGSPRQPGMAGPPVPGDDPVMQPEAQRWQTLVVDRDGR
jgi:hypothetical protein